VAIFEPATAVHVWVDTSGKLVDVSIPSQSLEAIRQEYAAKIDSFHKEIAELQKNQPKVEIDYSVPPNAPFTAEEVTVQAKGHTLGGTLLLPKSGHKPFPVVITITGSGQQTRDEALPLPGLEKYKPFRQIAEALAAKGIAVLRVDDRGVGKSTGLEGLKEATSFDFADDTRAQVAYLRSRPEIDPNRIAMIGHSEGGIIGPMVASTDPKIAAVALMAGTAKTGEKVIMDQVAFGLDGNPNTTKEQREVALQRQQVMLTAAMAGDTSVTVPDQMRLPWYVAFLKYDPLPTIGKVHQPILILQGAKDQQVTADQAPMLQEAALAAGNKDVTMHVFPGLNHLFLPSKTGAFTEYSHLEVTTLQPDVLDAITTWFQRTLKP
jgi:dipeptidyl aminopeptidase/acylaminoacyl peptidase